MKAPSPAFIFDLGGDILISYDNDCQFMNVILKETYMLGWLTPIFGVLARNGGTELFYL